MRHGTAISRWHYEPVAEGEQARRTSLLLLLAGVPAAAMAWQVWARMFVGPGAAVHDLHYLGWAAVWVALPASALVVGVAVASLVMASRACAAHVHGSEAVFWMSAVGLLLVLSVLGTTSADDVQAGASSALEWAVRGVALAVTAVAVAWARWWAYERGT